MKIQQNKALIVKFGKRKNQVAPVETFKQASEICRNYTEGNDLGFSDWEGLNVGSIFDTEGKEVARVSYNGRIWYPSNDWRVRNEVPAEIAESKYYE